MLLRLPPKPAPVDAPVLDVIRDRWSPRSLAPSPAPTDEELRTLFEAARWAPSSANAQPWRFTVARRGSASWATIFAALTPPNRPWAERAPVLAVTGAVDDDRRSWHDVGLASGFLLLQATELGLAAHLMAGFDAEAVGALLPDGAVAVCALAIGTAAPADELPSEALREKERAPRARRPLAELVRGGGFGP